MPSAFRSLHNDWHACVGSGLEKTMGDVTAQDVVRGYYEAGVRVTSRQSDRCCYVYQQNDEITNAVQGHAAFSGSLPLITSLSSFRHVERHIMISGLLS